MGKYFGTKLTEHDLFFQLSLIRTKKSSALIASSFAPSFKFNSIMIFDILRSINPN